VSRHANPTNAPVKFGAPAGGRFVREDARVEYLRQPLPRSVAHRLLRKLANQRAVQSKLDRGYEDRLEEKISAAFWERKSQTWEAELYSVHLPRSPSRVL